MATGLPPTIGPTILENRRWTMGGVGSGRWGEHSKALTVERCLALSIAMLKEWGVFQPLSWGVRGRITGLAGGQQDDRVVFVLRADDMETSDAHLMIWLGREFQQVRLAERLLLNASSWWMFCPCCGRKITKLYLPNGAWTGPSPFRCRRCWKLTYESAQTAHLWDRGWRGAFLHSAAFEIGIPFHEVARRFRLGLDKEMKAPIPVRKGRP